ncbi:zinc-ribbon domain-containing protein [Candidatus Pelagibacter sp.]|nr:zinc-ribbon domain-containing protein [Candidatus Pelagibacter sp.]
MIIECINCNKKFEVNSKLIPEEGRNIQCGSCNHLWFFDKNNQINLGNIKTKEVSIPPKRKKNNNLKKKVVSNNGTFDSGQKTALVKFEKSSDFTIGKFLSYILVGIISIITFIIFLDTFKSPLYNYFPNLEFLLFNLYETIIDISLFVKDLI